MRVKRSERIKSICGPVLVGALVLMAALLTGCPDGLQVGSAPDSDIGPLPDIYVPDSGPGDSVPKVCLTASPSALDFGEQIVDTPRSMIVTLISCGDLPLEVRMLALSGGSAASFALNLSGMGLGAATVLSEGDDPIILARGERVSFTATFTPAVISPLDAEGAPVLEVGAIRLVTNAANPVVEFPLQGQGVPEPRFQIQIVEGGQVIPQTKLHLNAAAVAAPSALADRYEWTVAQPVGSQSVFRPSAKAASPTFEVNVAGAYRFQLRVWETADGPSFVAATALVYVVPDEAIHIELLWNTPGDSDQTDEGPEAGSDLDLHFKHPLATGEDVDSDGVKDGWFDQPFDTFWFNPHPNWALLGPTVEDDPGLDRDDTDGAGPENINLNTAEDGHTYCVAVHYWNDHGFDESDATVRVYLHGVQVFEEADVTLVNHDLWEVACIAWPSGTVTPVVAEGGGFKIAPGYQNALFSN